jgi:hypothetical protein
LKELTAHGTSEARILRVQLCICAVVQASACLGGSAWKEGGGGEYRQRQRRRNLRDCLAIASRSENTTTGVQYFVQALSLARAGLGCRNPLHQVPRARVPAIRRILSRPILRRLKIQSLNRPSRSWSSTPRPAGFPVVRHPRHLTPALSAAVPILCHLPSLLLASAENTFPAIATIIL